MPKHKAQLKYIAVERLCRGEFQPRVHFDEQMLRELSLSIKEQGLIEPLVVRRLVDDEYEIIAGERRWRAAQLAGLSEVPCLLNDYTDEQAMAVTLIENIQREDLNVVEEALGYQRLVDEFYFLHDDIAKMVGKSRSHISNMLRLLSLCDEVKRALVEKSIAMGQAKMLVGLDTARQKSLLARIIKYDWSARKVENEVKRLRSSKPHSKSDRDVVKLEQLVAERFATKAEIEQDGEEGGWLKIKFFDNDTLAGLLDNMGVKYDKE